MTTDQMLDVSDWFSTCATLEFDVCSDAIPGTSCQVPGTIDLAPEHMRRKSEQLCRVSEQLFVLRERSLLLALILMTPCGP